MTERPLISTAVQYCTLATAYETISSRCRLATTSFVYQNIRLEGNYDDGGSDTIVYTGQFLKLPPNPRISSVRFKFCPENLSCPEKMALLYITVPYWTSNREEK